jgi:quinolinate synthase
MGRNLANELGKTVGRDLIIWQGKCVVHENFDPSSVVHYRKAYPGVKIMAHAECSPALVKVVDFVGGTGDMMKYVEGTKAKHYMLVTECGLGDLARTKFPGKDFLPMCRLCPYMKSVDLQHVLYVLEQSPKSHRIEVAPDIAKRAKLSIEKMFELAEDKAKL